MCRGSSSSLRRVRLYLWIWVCSTGIHGETARVVEVVVEVVVEMLVEEVAVDLSFAGLVTSQDMFGGSAPSVSRKTDRGRAYRA